MSFGVGLGDGTLVIAPGVRIALSSGQVVLLVGPSGSGKTSALERIHAQCAGACLVQRITFPPEVAVIDRIAPWASLPEALQIVTTCGLGEAPTWVRPFATLSDGEKFRARLARAVALHSRGQPAGPLLCDEFCSNLHRRAAKAISFNLRKLVTRRGLSAVVACSNDDITGDLRPDTIVRFEGAGRCRVERSAPRSSNDAQTVHSISFRSRLRVALGSKRHYEQFAPMHYRAADELGFVDKVFILREGFDGELLGVVVYAYSPLELTLRNQATGGRFVRQPKLVNRSIRMLRRLVIHPDVRGCGLGQLLVKKTLPRVGTAYVECLAAMGEFNPVFEKAGMQRIGQYPPHPKRQAAVEALKKLDVDPNARDFVLHVSRSRNLREIVAAVVHEWYESTTGGGKTRVQRQSPQLLAQTFRGLIGARPVYYLWRKRRLRRPRGPRGTTKVSTASLLLPSEARSRGRASGADASRGAS
jgi:ABC-type lipoprotein export system ATPase subunit/GNAT superfamily N-acetyltransferase